MSRENGKPPQPTERNIASKKQPGDDIFTHSADVRNLRTGMAAGQVSEEEFGRKLTLLEILRRQNNK